MKKVIMWLLAICLAAMLWGCGQPSEGDTIQPDQSSAGSMTSSTTGAGGEQAGATINPTLAALAKYILFRDGFQDGNMNYWKVTGGWSIFQDGLAFHVLGTSSGGAFVPWGLDWTDYVLRAAFRLDYGGVGFNYMLTDAGRYIILLHEQGTYLAKESPPGEVSVLAKAPAPTQGKWHWLAVASEGGQLQVFIDRQLIINVTDPDPLLAGTVGLGALDDSQAYVDDVIVAKRMSHLAAAEPGLEQTVVIPGQSQAPILELPVEEIAGPELTQVILDENIPVQQISANDLSLSLIFTVNGNMETTIAAGECAILQWNAINAIEVTLDDNPVMASGELSVCPSYLAHYTMRAKELSGETIIATVTVNVTNWEQAAGGLPDLAVSGLSASDGQINSFIPISITIVNNGTAAAGGFSVTIQDDGPNAPVGGMIDVAQVAAGASVTVSGTLYYSSAGSHTAYIIVDYFSAVPDSNRNNNGATVTVQVSGGEPPPPPVVANPPGAPGSCMAIGISSSAAQVAWAWGSDAKGYYVLSNGSTVATLPASSSSWIVDGLDAGTTYSFEVIAFNDLGSSPGGACTASATTSPAAEAPPDEPPAESTATDTPEPIPTETETPTP